VRGMFPIAAWVGKKRGITRGVWADRKGIHKGGTGRGTRGKCTQIPRCRREKKPTREGGASVAETKVKGKEKRKKN